MALPPPRPYATVNRYPVGATFIPRAPIAGTAGGAVAAGAGAGLGGLLGGIAVPLLCLGCLSTIALLGLFATMIAAAVYMNKIQRQIRQNIQGAGSIIEMNIFVLCLALFYSMHFLLKHRRGVASA